MDSTETTEAGSAFQKGMVREKKECFRASEYVRYLVYCNSWDALVCLNLGAGVNYLFFSIATVSEWILWKKAKEACSRRSSTVGHSSSLSMSPTLLHYAP